MASRPSRPSLGDGRLRASVLPVALAATAGLALLASGCGGGSSSEGVAQIGSTQTTTTGSGSADGSSSDERESALAYSRCMRENGVPNFPDPDSNGGVNIDPSIGVDPGSPQFKAAEEECKKVLPRGGRGIDPQQRAETREAALKYAACMRKNGVPKFPDPDANGGIAIQGGPGLDPNSPQFKAADEKCRDLLPGGAGGSLSSSDQAGTP